MKFFDKVIVVTNGYIDNTFEKAKKIGANCTPYRKKRGKGFAIRKFNFSFLNGFFLNFFI